MPIASAGDLLAFARLRWDTSFQRSQHLLTRAARNRRVFYVEEPQFGIHGPVIQHHVATAGVTVLTPLLPRGLSEAAVITTRRMLIDAWLRRSGVVPQVLWYDSPHAIAFTGQLDAPVIAYDCADDDGTRRSAPDDAIAHERALLQRADVVFAGSVRLFEAACAEHHNVHFLPSCQDAVAIRWRAVAPAPRETRHHWGERRHDDPARITCEPTSRLATLRGMRAAQASPPPVDRTVMCRTWNGLWQHIDGELQAQAAQASHC